MRPSFCQSCVASIIKFLIFLQAFVGVSVLIYSVWILDQWHRHGDGDNLGLLANLLDLDDLPDPWFAYCLMGIGLVMCLFAFTGYVAAEAVSGSCLCFYALLSSLIILFEAALLGYLLLDKHWQEDLPNDPTGELGRLRAFIESNIAIFKWVGLAVVVIQALSLLLAIILRAMVSTESDDCDSDEDDFPTRRSLLNHQYVPSQV